MISSQSLFLSRFAASRGMFSNYGWVFKYFFAYENHFLTIHLPCPFSPFLKMIFKINQLQWVTKRYINSLWEVVEAWWNHWPPPRQRSWHQILPHLCQESKKFQGFYKIYLYTFHETHHISYYKDWHIIVSFVLWSYSIVQIHLTNGGRYYDKLGSEAGSQNLPKTLKNPR